MGDIIGPILLGLCVVILGVCNFNGNINSIHWYHRQRITEENKKMFGRLMGVGTIFCGVGIMVLGLSALAAQSTGNELFTTIGSAIVMMCVAVGLGISFYAMIKYNKGIF